MSDIHNSRIQRLSLPIVLLLHILGIVIGGGLFFIIGALVVAALGIPTKGSGVLIALAITLFGAFLPSFFIRRARRQHSATPQPAVQATQKEPPAILVAESPRSGRSGLVIVTSLLGLATLGLVLVLQSESGKSLFEEIARGDQIPKCDSSITADTLKSMVTSAPTSKLINIKVFAIREAREVAWSEQGQIRRCTARVFTNAGTDDLSFRIYWIDRAKGEFYVETE